MAAEVNPRVSTEGLLVRLYPFLHQVSGSSLMFMFDQHTICKPLVPKEYDFYKRLPEGLKSFTAEYKGSVEIQTEESSDGTRRFYAVVPHDKILSLQLCLTEKHCHCQKRGCCDSTTCPTMIDFLQNDELKVKRSGSIEIDEDSLDCYDDPTMKIETGARLNRKLVELLATQHRFILLENLVGNFTNPSILDLKMGTRTYGDDDDDGKKMRKQRRAEASTSKNLGVRIHGMQKYNNTTGKYVTFDKFDGLKFSVAEFQSAMTEFLHDGVRMRLEVVRPIVQRLKQFYECVSQQDTFRFYSSSLLVIYDGARTTNKAEVRAIDFAHATYHSSPFGGQINHLGPDKGYLLGIETLINTFSAFTD